MVELHHRAQDNVLDAIRHSIENLGSSWMTVHDIGCVCSIRADRRAPSDEDTLRVCKILKGRGFIVETKNPRDNPFLGERRFTLKRT